MPPATDIASGSHGTLSDRTLAPTSHPIRLMLGTLVAEMAARRHAEPGDLRPAPRLAWRR
jgi:hypothetical protein